MKRRIARDADRRTASAVPVVSSAVPRQFRPRQALRSGGRHGWNQCAAVQEQHGARSSANCAHESNERANVLRLCRRPNRTTRKKGNPRDHKPPRNRRCSRSEEHTSELQSRLHLVCRLLLEKKKKKENKLTVHYNT